MLERTRQSYPTFERLASAFSSGLQSVLLSRPEMAYSEKSPSISDLDRLYSSGASALWVKTQLATLDFASQTKESADMDALQEFSTLFAARYGGIKLTEFLTFIARFKLGRYGKFYGYFDTLTIGDAFRKFLDERAVELDAVERKRNSEERERQQATPVQRDHEPPQWLKAKLRLKPIR